MRQTRKIRSIRSLRGAETIAKRVPFRRISVELPEALWAKLKLVAVETGIPLSRLLCEAAEQRYGLATEAEIVSIYAQMDGLLPEPPKPEPPKPAVAVAPQFTGFSAFSVDTSYSAPVQPMIQPEKKDQPEKAGLNRSVSLLQKQFKKP